MKKTHFIYDKEAHTTICEISSGGKIFRGTAQCHPDDYDFESQKVGEVFSHFRAIIAQCRYDKEVIDHQVTSLTHVLDALCRNPKVDRNSIECKVIRKQIKILKRDKEEIEETIQHAKAELKYLIRAKDELYTRVRQRRAAENESASQETENSVHS